MIKKEEKKRHTLYLDDKIDTAILKIKNKENRSLNNTLVMLLIRGILEYNSER